MQIRFFYIDENDVQPGMQPVLGAFGSRRNGNYLNEDPRDSKDIANA